MRIIKILVGLLSIAALLLLLAYDPILIVPLAIIFVGVWLAIGEFEEIEEDYELDDIPLLHPRSLFTEDTINAKNIATNSIYGLTSAKFDTPVKDSRDTFNGYTFKKEAINDGQGIYCEPAGAYKDNKKTELYYSHQ